MRRHSVWLILAAAGLTLTGCGTERRHEPQTIVLAAASMQESLTDAADQWSAAGHPRPVLSFAASSALARQIESGAKADLFISADEDWMNEIEAKGLIRSGSRRLLVRNALVMIAPVDGPRDVALTPLGVRTALGGGRMAMADPDSVPAGKYARAALQSLRLWPLVRDEVASGENVRAALAFVERGEAPLGIVYLTDARVSKKVHIVATFPENSHSPITYPIAALKSAASDAPGFEQFLLSADGQRIFASYGFGPGKP